MTGHSGCCFFRAATISRVGSMTQRSKPDFGQDAGPGIEQLNHFDARRDLRREPFGRCRGQHPHQRGKALRITIGPTLDPAKIPAAPAFDHVGGDGPRCPGEADQRGLRPERRTHAPNRFEHGFEPQESTRGIQPRNAGGIGDRIEHGSFAVPVGEPLPQRVRQHQDVGKEDRGIHAEPPYRLQGQLGRQGGSEAQLDKILRLASHPAIFGQVAAGLSHQPPGRW